VGKCITCGARSLSDNSNQCVWCGKVACGKCYPESKWVHILYYKTKMEDLNGRASYSKAPFCSDQCYNTFWSKVLTHSVNGVTVNENAQSYWKVQVDPNATANNIGTDVNSFGTKIVTLWNQAILSAVTCASPSVSQNMGTKLRFACSIHTNRNYAFPIFRSDGHWTSDYANFHYARRKILSNNLARSGRFEDAAKIEEELGNYNGAGELRLRAKEQIIRKTDISVNLNSLLQQIKDGGIVADYHCPNCSSPLQINDKSTVSSLKICEHCGHSIDTVNLAEFLKNIR
jgi:hypothetical protein